MYRILEYRGLLVLLLGCCALLLPTIASSQGMDISQKSRYLYNFYKLSDWNRHLDDPFLFCIVEDKSVATDLQMLVTKHNFGNLKVGLFDIDYPRGFGECGVVFFPQNTITQEQVPSLTHTLVVTEDGVDGDITLFLSDNQLKFFVDKDRLSLKSFKVGPRLYELSDSKPRKAKPNSK